MDRLQDRAVGSPFQLAGGEVPSFGVGLKFLEGPWAGVDDKTRRKNRRRTFGKLHEIRA